MESHAGQPVRTGVASIQAQVDDARENQAAVRVTGRSHWLDAGRPVNAERTITTSSHTGVVDYIPGDLTITVRAGTSLREIAEVTAREGQWFPLDPPGNDDGSIGATIATGSSGRLAQRFGGIRDLVLGLEFVAGDGKVVRGGGRVVKNVAGFDLTRLLTGSWGTLGIITEASLRLYSAESQPATFVLALPDDASQLAARIALVRAAPLAPYATELVNAGVAASLGLPSRTSLVIELGGNRAAVASQRDALVSLGAHQVDSRPWEKLRLLDGEGSSVLRISALASRVLDVWETVCRALGSAGDALIHAGVGAGVVRCIVPAGSDPEIAARIVAACADFSVVFERLPAAMWETLSPGVSGDRLSRGIKQAFDPANILNPGILGD
ncbi:MAG: FAD-binding oxidoreductase [Gemmatimonadaceae bacterium]|nr:FAD-binding oxidoreductase [Gemmatimonadaceae bacterium]